MEGTTFPEGHISSTASGKTWAELVAADRAIFTSNGLSMHKPATVAVTDLMTNLSDRPDRPDRLGHSEIVEHKAEVPPIFMVYWKVSADGECISLMQVATAVLQIMGDQSTIDAVQPMRQGWYIYMRTLKDHAMLVERGLTIAGRFVPLRSELRQDVT